MTENVADLLQEYAEYADELFNGSSGVSNGFIGYSTNLQENPSPPHTHEIPSLPIPYGYENVWHKPLKELNLDRIKALSEKKKKDTRIYLRELNLITPEDIFEIFRNTVYMQNNYGAVIENPSGKRVVLQRGRYSQKKGARQSYVGKRIKSEIQAIGQVIMLSLTFHQPIIQKLMPDNTNMLPIEFTILHCWEYLNAFLKRLRDYLKRRSIPWGYIGAILQFQDDKDENGFPHFHILFQNRWLGPLDEISAMWPYSPRQGVDIMTKAKWEKEHPGQKYTPLRVSKYLSKYLRKSCFFDAEKGVHKCHAIASFYGVRMFNFAHEYRPEKTMKKDTDDTWKYIGMESA